MRGHRQAGFTLIEVVVAFVLLAVVLTTAFDIFSSGMRRAGELEDYSRALVIAQSQLAAAGVEQPFQQGQTQGQSDDGRFRWVVEVAPADPQNATPSAAAVPPTPYLLYRIDVRVEWQGADTRPRNVSLGTLGMGART